MFDELKVKNLEQRKTTAREVNVNDVTTIPTVLVLVESKGISYI